MDKNKVKMGIEEIEKLLKENPSYSYNQAINMVKEEMYYSEKTTVTKTAKKTSVV